MLPQNIYLNIYIGENLHELIYFSFKFTDLYNVIFYRVKQLESKNLMSAKNISVIFGPTLFRGPDPSSEILDMNSRNAAVEYILEHSNLLFLNNGERIKPGYI
jgi:hypothetical protein